MGSVNVDKGLFLFTNTSQRDHWDQFSRLTCATLWRHPAPPFHVIGEAQRIGPNDPKPHQRSFISLENNGNSSGLPRKYCPHIRDQWDQWRAHDLIRVQGYGDLQ